MVDAAIRYAKTPGWLLVPVFAWNLALASRLPDRYLPGTFDAGIPAALAVPETVLRIFVFGLPFLAPFELRSARQRRGLAIYLVGIGLYFAGWLALVVAPDSAWSRSAPGFLAPAYTPAVWLFGLALLMQRLHWPASYRWWFYPVLCGAFLTAHVGHATLVLLR